jgi:trimeric autotransporter adhesin
MKASTMRAFCTFAVVICFGRASRAIEWEQISPYPTTAKLTCVAHGGNVDVAAGRNGIVYSEDAGTNWVRVAGRDGLAVTDLKYGNGVFVATTVNEGILRSTDGKKWTSENAGAPYFSCLVFGNGLFVAGGGDVATSTDGVNWKLFPKVSPMGLTLGAYGNGRFVFKEAFPDPDGKQYAVVSTDGTHWSRVEGIGVQRTVCMPPTFPPSPIPNCGTAHWRGLVFAKGFFYAHVTWFGPNVNESWYFKCPDGVNWTPSGSRPISWWYPDDGTFSTPTDLTFLNDRFFVLGYNNGTANGYAAYIFSSPDLVNWTTNFVDTPDRPLPALGMTTNGSSYLVVGGSGMIARGSLDSLKREDNPGKYLGIVTAAVHGETIVAGGRLPHGIQQDYTFPLFVVSTNGGKGFFSPTSASASLRSISTIRYMAGRFIAVGNGQILSSMDGVEWSFPYYGPSLDLYDIAHDGQTWAAVGGSGTILVSTNEVDFGVASSGTTLPLYGITHGNGMWVACGSGPIVRSSNGIDWMVSNAGARLWSIAFGNGRFVAVGDAGKVFVSTNAIDWTEQQVGTGQFARVAFAHGMFAAVVDLSPVTYYSTDGVNWIRRVAYRANLRDIAACDDVFWISGANVENLNTQFQYSIGPFIFREREDTPVMVSAGTPADDWFTLRLNSTSYANYRIYSADDIVGPWEIRETLTNVIGDISWRETNSAATRFYKIRQE